MKSCIFWVSCFVILALNAWAEEPTRGVLPDGTPFRTDVNGNQIVDYIAELENAVDTLNRRISGLEVNTASKQAIIDRYLSEPAQSGKRPQRIVERDLATVEHTQDTFYAGTESARGSQDVALATVKSGQSNEMAWQTQLTELQNLNAALNAANMALRQKLDEAQQQKQSVLYNSENDSARWAALLEQKQSEIDQWRSRASEMSSEFKSASAAAPQAQAQPKPVKVVPVLSGPGGQQSESREEEPRASMVPQSSKRLLALQSTQGMLRTELNKLNGLILKRKVIFAKYTKSQQGGVTFRLSELESNRKLNSKAISSKIDFAQRISDLLPLRADINEIRYKLEDDIRLIERMNKVG